MNTEVNTLQSYQPGAPVPCIQTPFYQQTSYNQYVGFYQGAPVQFQDTHNLSSMATTFTQPPQPQSNTFLYYRGARNYTQNYCMPPMSVGPNGTENLPFMAMTGTQTPQPPPRTLELNQRTLDGPQKKDKPKLPGNSGDLTACQLRNTRSSLPQEMAGASAHSSMKPTDNVQKRELRLYKNREAARECRRKKKEYVKCLENRVAVLENQNKTLIEELRALKDIYRHKVE